MDKTIIISLSMLLFLSCKQEKATTESITQMKNVIMIHDEVMADMGKLAKLVDELKGKVDTTETGKEYNRAMKDLQLAHTAMMDWMHGFGDRFDSDEILNGKSLSEEKRKWLDEEEAKVKALREQINTSIQNAEELLK